MSISNSVIDGEVIGICDKIRERAENEFKIKNDEPKLKSLAFTYLCVKETLDLSEPEQIFDCLTDGSGDGKIDALYYELNNDDFIITLFQSKYHQNIDNTKEFSNNAIDDLIKAISLLLDPKKSTDSLNSRLKVKVDEIHSIIKEGYLPIVEVKACSNGRKWNKEADKIIKENDPNEQTNWEHIGYDTLLSLKNRQKAINYKMQTIQKSIVDGLGYTRMAIGQISLGTIAKMVEEYGDRLFDKNIRRYLGLHNNRVNDAISETINGKDVDYFFLLNNGITMICDKFDYNEKQSEDRIYNIEKLQIINGGQTCMTIYKTLLEQVTLFDNDSRKEATVLFRLYQLPNSMPHLVDKITFATNSQNAVDLSDLKSNDDIQWKLALDIKGLGFNYRFKRDNTRITALDLTPKATAEAVIAIWCQIPQKSKFYSKEHFDKFYLTIFKNLNGASAITAVLLYRIAENFRKRPSEDAPLFTRYSSPFIAMQMGKKLLLDLKISDYKKLNHTNFNTAYELIKEKGLIYFNESVNDIAYALRQYYNKDIEDISHTLLPSIFRRGDLIDYL